MFGEVWGKETVSLQVGFKSERRVVGFELESENAVEVKVSGTWIVHSYGHGGGGY